MSHLIVATVQMNAMPTSLDDRLARAEKLVQQAVTGGAKLVVLPELFNAGYSYTPVNYDYIEAPDGKTVTWMKAQASQYAIYLASSILIEEDGDIYNRAYLIAPDGRIWQYDKIYPFGWERAFFRENKNQVITVADTEFGKVGILICWDSAHADLWAQYAGKVNLMLIPSCPPDMHKPTLTFADGSMIQLYADDNHFAQQDIHDQTAWLGVPTIHSSGAGHFSSTMPRPVLSLIGLLARNPRVLLKHICKANQAVLGATFTNYSKIVDATGQLVAQVDVADEDGVAIATLEIPENLSNPIPSQPPMRTKPFTFFIVDKVNVALVKGVYNRAMKRQK